MMHAVDFASTTRTITITNTNTHVPDQKPGLSQARPDRQFLVVPLVQGPTE